MVATVIITYMVNNDNISYNSSNNQRKLKIKTSDYFETYEIVYDALDI